MISSWKLLVATFALVVLAAATAVGSPASITAGPDGNVWFTESDYFDVHGDRVGLITPSGAVREFWRGIRGYAQPDAITAGPDGNLWFTEPGRNAVGRITPQGRVTEWPQKGIGYQSASSDITAGPDGNIWFTEPYRDRVARMTPSGVVTEFSRGIGRDSSLSSIVAGPDGNLWFTQPGEGPSDYPVPWWEDAPARGRIGRITPTGRVTEFTSGISGHGWPESITAGPDGNLWFTEPYNDAVAQITPAGVVTEFTRGISRCARPSSITAGPDGNLWFTEPGSADADTSCNGPGRIGRITTEGVVTEFRVPAPGAITAGPDGALWFTEPEGNAIGRITTAGVVTTFPPPARIDRIRPVGRRGLFVRVRCASCRGTVRLLDVHGTTSPGSEVVGARRFSARGGHAARFVVPLSAHGRLLLAARGSLTVRARVQAEPSRLLGSRDGAGKGELVTLREPAAIRGMAVNLRATPAIKAQLRAAHLALRPGIDRSRTRGPLPGSTYYARLGTGEWAIADFWNPGTGSTDSIAIFNRAVHGRWFEIGDTWNPCEGGIPRPVQVVWDLEGCR